MENCLQYFDNTIVINAKYIANFEEFSLDCNALNLVNPVVKNDYFIYSCPIEIEKDVIIGGKAKIYNNSKGEEDKTSYVAMDDIINNLQELLNAQQKRIRTEAELKIMLAEEALTIDQKLERAYKEAWPLSKQIEALRDALNGDSVKLNKMNEDFTRIKLNLKDK